jgi:ATP synthase protein I
VALSLHSRPIRVVLGWQALVTVAMTALCGGLAGVHGAVSAAIGGSTGIAGGLAFVWMASRSRAESPERLVYSALRAETLKLAVFVCLLWIVLATYQNVVVLGLIGSFLVSTVVFTLAIFVRDA